MSDEAPSWLSEDARTVWAELSAASSDPLGLAGPDFEAYCVQVGRMRDAQRRIDEEGLVVADEKGRPVPHPAIAIEKAAQAEVRAWGSRFR